jgi:MscS family membrane protein
LIWKFASSTVADIEPIYSQIGLASVLEHLPNALTGTQFLEMAPWQWIGMILLVLVAWLAAWVIASVIVRILKPLTRRSATELDDKLLELFVGPLRLVATIGVLNAGLHLLLLSVPANHFAREVSKVLLIGAVAWLVFRAIDLLAAATRGRLTERGQMGAVYLVPLGARAIKIAVGAMTFLATLDTFGFDVTAIIAGLGVGGLALALAAQKTLENFFGGVSVLVDQPVRPGDFCRFGDNVGTVEDIGVRSTRIRTLDRTVITVPNAEFSGLQLENFAKRDSIRLITTLGLRYETTPDQLRHVLNGLRRILLAHPKVLPDPQRVRMVGFGAYSLDLEVFAYVDTQDYNEFLAVREDIFLRMMQVIEESGSGFAFPSSTTYLARDGGLDRTRSRAAEAEVARWRAEGKLPFPDLAPDEVQAIDGTLDWPPQGSIAKAAG